MKTNRYHYIILIYSILLAEAELLALGAAQLLVILFLFFPTKKLISDGISKLDTLREIARSSTRGFLHLYFYRNLTDI